MSSDNIVTDKRERFGMTAENWKRHDSKTDEEITAAALSDPDAQPLTDEELAKLSPAT